MGTTCHVRVVAPDEGAGWDAGAELDWAQSEVNRMERLWTRFNPDSELMTLGPQPTEVDPATALLVTRAVAGHELSGGLFNPFLVAQVRAAGYDRDFASLEVLVTPQAGTPAAPARITVAGNMVSTTLPIDSGGIGKGLAADLIASALRERGAAGALVNLGGDLRCLGVGRSGPWRVTLRHPIAGLPPLSVNVTSGAVCTSTPLLRRWRVTSGGFHHHLIDPRTGRPAAERYAAVTVIAPEAWLGEVLCKVVFLADRQPARDLLHRFNAAALLSTASGEVTQL